MQHSASLAGEDAKIVSIGSTRDIPETAGGIVVRIVDSGKFSHHGPLIHDANPLVLENLSHVFE
jgi:hypothetical protein